MMHLEITGTIIIIYELYPRYTNGTTDGREEK